MGSWAVSKQVRQLKFEFPPKKIELPEIGDSNPNSSALAGGQHATPRENMLSDRTERWSAAATKDRGNVESAPQNNMAIDCLPSLHSLLIANAGVLTP